MPKIITIRPDDIDSDNIEALKTTLNQTAASRALLIAAAKLPYVMESLEKERARNGELTAELNHITRALSARQSATQDILEWLGKRSDDDLHAEHVGSQFPTPSAFLLQGFTPRGK